MLTNTAKLQAQEVFDENIERRQVPAMKTHTMVLGDGGNDLFAAGVADMDFKAPPYVLDALQRRLDHGIFGYEAVPEGLLLALITWLKQRHGWQVNEEHILRSPNILNSLALAASLFAEEGDNIIVQSPVFFDFYDVVKENHRNLESNPLILKKGRYEFDFEGLERIASKPKSKILFLCNPHNPVGRVWTRDELTQLGDICLRNNVIVVSDEIHADIVFAGHQYTPFASISAEFSDNSITLISPAKSFNIASCCSSFTIISNEAKRKAYQIENSRITANKNNAFASAAMQAAYTSCGPWLDGALDYLQSNLKFLRKELESISGVTLIEPQGTFLAWLDFRALGFTPDELTSFLKQQARWAVTRGQAFGVEGEGFARVNIACTRSTLKTALERLSSAVARLN